jgi:hypothetical protein
VVLSKDGKEDRRGTGGKVVERIKRERTDKKGEEDGRQEASIWEGAKEEALRGIQLISTNSTHSPDARILRCDIQRIFWIPITAQRLEDYTGPCRLGGLRWNLGSMPAQKKALVSCAVSKKKNASNAYLPDKQPPELEPSP